MVASISVVIPAYRSAATLPILLAEIKETDWWSESSEIILVDDGNSDNTWSTIVDLTERFPNVIGIRLSRNVGQHAAIIAGVRHAHHSLIVTMDDDLQNPPAEISKLVAALSTNIDVVYGIPEKTQQPIWRSLTSRMSKRAMSSGLGFKTATEISSFRVFRTQLRESFERDLGPGVSLDALLNWSTSRFASVRVQHQERENGHSNYNFFKLTGFMIDTATGYSTLPLRFATGFGLATISLSFCVLIWVIGRPLISGESVPGFPFLAATIAIFSGTQLLVLGILGQYLGRMHFRVMNKPTYSIAEITTS